jgi:hypothetical protein
VTLSYSNYDSLLIGWDALELVDDLSFHAGSSQYCSGSSARANIISVDNWTITDGGYNDSLCGGPIVDFVSISPLEPWYNDTLLGYCNATDSDLDNLTYYYRWYRDDVFNVSGSYFFGNSSGQNINVNNISNSSTLFGEDWIFSCMVSDGAINSSWVNSSSVFIYEPFSPVVDSVNISPLNPGFDDDLLGYCNATDSNFDNLTYYYKWYKDGVSNVSGGGAQNYTQGFKVNVNNLSNSLTADGENWSFSCLASDGTFNSSWMNSSIVFVSSNYSDCTEGVYSGSFVNFNVSQLNNSDQLPVNNLTSILNGQINYTAIATCNDGSVDFSLEVNETICNSGYSLVGANCKIVVGFNDADYSFDSTNFSIYDLIDSPISVQNPVLKNNFGLINYTENVTINESINITGNILISQNSIFVDSAFLPTFSKPAILKIFGLGYTDPVIMRNGAECSDSICTLLSYSGGNLSFSVTSFSNYSVSEGPICGDSSCNGDETCSSCAEDCGVCSDNDGDSSGGGDSELNIPSVKDEIESKVNLSMCNNGILDSGEEGIDCGSICGKSCFVDSLKDISDDVNSGFLDNENLSKGGFFKNIFSSIGSYFKKNAANIFLNLIKVVVIIGILVVLFFIVRFFVKKKMRHDLLEKYRQNIFDYLRFKRDYGPFGFSMARA